MNDSESGQVPIMTGNGFCTPWNTIPIPNDAYAQSLLQNDTALRFATYIIPVIIIVGFFSNMAFLFMVLKISRMHTITNFYLANIAIADLIFTCIVSPIYVTSVMSSPVFGNIPFDIKNACFVIFYFSYGSWAASVGGVTVVSFERFLAVCYPLQQYRIATKSRTVSFAIGIWIFAILLGGVMTPRYGKTFKVCLKWPDDDKYSDMPTIFQTCLPMGTGNVVAIYSEIVEAASFFIALIVNLYFYFRIIYALSSRSIAGEATGGDTKQLSQTTQIRNQVARALVINGIVFFVTQTPYRINNMDGLAKTISGVGFLSKNQSDTLKIISRGFLYLNSAINSFIYAFSSSFYRQGFIEAFSCSFLNRRSKNELTSISEKTSHTKI